MLSATRTAAIIFPNWTKLPGHDDSDRAHRAFEPIVRALSSVAPLIHVDTAGVALLATRALRRISAAMMLSGIYYTGSVQIKR